jgi:hypothetical protein
VVVAVHGDAQRAHEDAALVLVVAVGVGVAVDFDVERVTFRGPAFGRDVFCERKAAQAPQTLKEEAKSETK